MYKLKFKQIENFINLYLEYLIQFATDDDDDYYYSRFVKPSYSQAGDTVLLKEQ